MPDELPEPLRFEPCDTRADAKLFAVKPLWHVPGTPKVRQGWSEIRLAACCVGHAMWMGWKKAEEANDGQIKMHKPSRVVGVFAREIEGAEADELRAMIEKAKEEDQL